MNLSAGVFGCGLGPAAWASVGKALETSLRARPDRLNRGLEAGRGRGLQTAGRGSGDAGVHWSSEPLLLASSEGLSKLHLRTLKEMLAPSRKLLDVEMTPRARCSPPRWKSSLNSLPGTGTAPGPRPRPPRRHLDGIKKIHPNACC